MIFLKATKTCFLPKKIQDTSHPNTHEKTLERVS
jgi:hypothetical protein